MDFPRHVEAPRRRLESRLELFDAEGMLAIEHELDGGEEAPRIPVIEFMKLSDETVAIGKEAADGGDNADTSWTHGFEDISRLVLHDMALRFQKG